MNEKEIAQKAPKAIKPTKVKKSSLSPVARSKYTGYPTSDGESRNVERGLKSDEDRMSGLCGQVELLREMLKANHLAIDNCAHLLNKSQPPRSGKIEVRWWIKNGAALPFIVQWGSDKKFIQLSPSNLVRRANRTGNFERNYEDTVKILSILSDLIDSRSLLIKYIGEFKRWISRYKNESHKALLSANEFKIFEGIEARIDERAREADV